MKKFGKQLTHEIDKGTKQLDKEADKLGRAADKSIENNTGIQISHITNPDASDHKEAVKNAKETTGLGGGTSENSDSVKLAGDQPEVTNEG
ncbi:hypothetical protein [Rickettsia endosymbiont of Halotydeus destructor]|uniref:hypothetical protein n=1 Tax=Rickettsia endosymbiont of Halotydeus destructor TaxID=2996754 RepID=UPI003BB069B9